MCYNMKGLYTDDDDVSESVVTGETGTPVKQLNAYSEKEVYEKFIQL